MASREAISGALAAAVLAAGLVGGCGGEDVRYSDEKIVDRLNLEKSDNGYSIDGDIFCEVKKDLLNDADQVEEAADKDQLGLVIASAGGNAGVEGVPVFSPDCKSQAKEKLNKLDPEPEE